MRCAATTRPTTVLEDYRELLPGKVTYYDGMIRIDLSKQESMIALPFHPSNAYTIHELQANPEEILRAVEEDARSRFGDKIDVHLYRQDQEWQGNGRPGHHKPDVRAVHTITLPRRLPYSKTNL